MPAWATTASDCLKVALPPSRPEKTPCRMPVMITRKMGLMTRMLAAWM